MRFRLHLMGLAIGSCLFAGTAWAQSAEDYHPMLSDRFNLSLGAFLPKKSLKISVDVDKSDWQGSAEAVNQGPYLALTATW